MKATARLSVLIGAGLLAGGLAAGPAQASPGHSHDNYDVIGYFDDESDCDAVADFGERVGHWDDAYCDEVESGPHDGMWALTADCDYDGHRWVVRDNDFFFDNDFPFNNGWNGWNGWNSWSGFPFA
ncbi:hypothetical protein ACQPZX_39415 [Actinoplanes sp. CA-142083]|uniref:hypothetical protein n=1 Tax=Actinoplanes sp. CA-142083 TaxID=3239903 RepID=UPI003D8D7AE7